MVIQKTNHKFHCSTDIFANCKFSHGLNNWSKEESEWKNRKWMMTKIHGNVGMTEDHKILNPSTKCLKHH